MTKELNVKLHPKLEKWRKAIEKKGLVDAIVESSFEVGYINTGSTVLNLLIGGTRLSDGSFVCPGWPRSSIVEIIGRESSGKTTIALTAMAHAIAAGGAGVYVDLECAVKDHYAGKLGVDFRSISVGGDGKAIRVSPHTFEETEAIVTAAALNGVDLVVVDSVAGLVSRREIMRDTSNEKEKLGIAEIPRLMSQWMPKLQNIISRTKTCVIFTNQTRDKIGAFGHNEETIKGTTGGNALKFWASIRVWLKPKMATKAKKWNPLLGEFVDIQIANDVECKMIKNKIDAKQGHAGLLTIRYGIGIDELRTMMNVAEAYDIVKVSKKKKDSDSKGIDKEKKEEKNAEYSFTPPKSGKTISEKGIEKFRLALLRSPEMLKDFNELCQERIIQGYDQVDDEELARLADGAEYKSYDDDGEEYTGGEPPEVSTESEEDGPSIQPLNLE